MGQAEVADARVCVCVCVCVHTYIYTYTYIQFSPKTEIFKAKTIQIILVVLLI